eukprot:scaffold9893_cov23-Prasinocladus_malaysianus.AAC.1
MQCSAIVAFLRISEMLTSAPNSFHGLEMLRMTLGSQLRRRWDSQPCLAARARDAVSSDNVNIGNVNCYQNGNYNDHQASNHLDNMSLSAGWPQYGSNSKCGVTCLSAASHAYLLTSPLPLNDGKVNQRGPIFKSKCGRAVQNKMHR